jgi:hypothetical protein
MQPHSYPERGDPPASGTRLRSRSRTYSEAERDEADEQLRRRATPIMPEQTHAGGLDTDDQMKSDEAEISARELRAEVSSSSFASMTLATFPCVFGGVVSRRSLERLRRKSDRSRWQLL